MNTEKEYSPLQPESENLMGRIFSAYKYFWLAMGIVFIDQLVKLAVKFKMPEFKENVLFSINFIENEGAAFGLTLADIAGKIGIDLTPEGAKVMLTVFSLAAVVGITWFLSRVKDQPSRLPLFLALILGGAVGNIIDRVFYGVWFAGLNDYEGGLFHGRVVDMFYLNIYHGKILGFNVDLLPIFNIADAAISVGIGAVILGHRKLFGFIRQGTLKGHENVSPMPEKEGFSPSAEEE